MEQTFKVSEYDISSEDDLKKILSPEFIEKALERFQDMHISLRSSMDTIWDPWKVQMAHLIFNPRLFWEYF